MNAISKVIESVKDTFRFIKLLKFGDSDNVNSFLITSFGEDVNVPKDYKALFIRTSNSSEPVCVGFINKILFDLNAGEKQIFSTNETGDEVSSFLKFLNDGTSEWNGNADFIAGYTKLKEGFDIAIEDLNGTIAELNKIINALNSWTPTLNDGGLALKTLILSDPPIVVTDSTATIDESKKDNLKIE